MILAAGAWASAAAADGNRPGGKGSAAPAYSWTGFYVGGNFGHGWADASENVDPLPNPGAFGASPFSVAPSPEGVLGGVQIGYNVQVGTFVYGIEADIAAAELEDTVVTTPLLTSTGTPVAGWNSVLERS